MGRIPPCLSENFPEGPVLRCDVPKSFIFSFSSYSVLLTALVNTWCSLQAPSPLWTDAYRPLVRLM